MRWAGMVLCLIGGLLIADAMGGLQFEIVAGVFLIGFGGSWYGRYSP